MRLTKNRILEFEDKWGFDQVFPMLLLVSPVLSCIFPAISMKGKKLCPTCQGTTEVGDREHLLDDTRGASSDDLDKTELRSLPFYPLVLAWALVIAPPTSIIAGNIGTSIMIDHLILMAIVVFGVQPLLYFFYTCSSYTFLW
jgi:hypothetical protein